MNEEIKAALINAGYLDKRSTLIKRFELEGWQRSVIVDKCKDLSIAISDRDCVNWIVGQWSQRWVDILTQSDYEKIKAIVVANRRIKGHWRL